MDYAITKQIPPLATPGTRTSQINRVFNAGLAAFLNQQEGMHYEHLYNRYMGTAPRFRPRSSDCDPWVTTVEMNSELRALLDSGVIRFGYVPGAPYVYSENDELTGFDYELAQSVTELIGMRYFSDAHRLRAEWVEVKLASDEQSDKLTALYKGLLHSDFDIALSGQMMLPLEYMKGIDIEWTAPTAMLFTAITYTGRDQDKLDMDKLSALYHADLPAFQEYAAEESRRLDLELRIFSVFNPGPSPTSAMKLVYNINSRKARAVWHTGDIADSNTVMLEATGHFTVGDSLASGAQTLLPGFEGQYLNIPANDELWPIAGFTARRSDLAAGMNVAVFAEHSDSKKPMTTDESLPHPQQGWNVRVFNRTEFLHGTGISLEEGTGIITLGRGFYHITGCSIVTYDDLATPGHVTTDAQPYAGYCRLRRVEDIACGNEKAICIGTMSTANMLPSTFETYLEVPYETRIILEHQVGNDVEHIYLQGIWENSSWHVFARIAIRRLQE